MRAVRSLCLQLKVTFAGRNVTVIRLSGTNKIAPNPETVWDSCCALTSCLIFPARLLNSARYFLHVLVSFALMNVNQKEAEPGG
jgi:hypothetical protein